MVVLEGWLFLMSEVPLYRSNHTPAESSDALARAALRPADAFGSLVNEDTVLP